MRNWPPPDAPGGGVGSFGVARAAVCQRGLGVGGDIARWAALSGEFSHQLSVANPALEGGEDQVAHVVDVALEAVVVDLAILVAPLLDARINRMIAIIRAKVEHPSRVIKRQFGHVKTRYRGLAKNRAQLFTLFTLANLFLVRRRLTA